MSTKSKYGTAIYNGTTLNLTQHAQQNNRLGGYDAIGKEAEISLDPYNFYTASAEDADGNDWIVYWQIIDQDQDDESDLCDWGNVFYAKKLD